MKISFKIFAFILILVGNPPLFARAEDATYDKYTATLRDSRSDSASKVIAANLLTYPLELVRWPLGRLAKVTDEQSFLAKTRYVIEKAADYGVIPIFDSVTLGSNLYGVSVDYVRLLRQKNNYPNFVVKNWFSYAPKISFNVGGKIGLERIADTGFHAFGSMDYTNLPREYFYGIGPHTSKADGSSYHIEETKIDGLFGYSPNPAWNFDTRTGYKRVNITDGRVKGRPNIDNYFNPAAIPGLDGDELFHTGLEMTRDTRDYESDSTQGNLLRLGWHFNEGLYNSEARFFQYVTEAAQYVPLWSKRRVFVARFFADYNNALPGHEVPFHQMARLGGYGTFPRTSQTLRAYEYNRFFDNGSALLNFEYRYNIWEHGDWKVDAVTFYEVGQVFERFRKFNFSEFRQSYGVGLRLAVLRHIIGSVELAHGDEGTQFYVKSSAPF